MEPRITYSITYDGRWWYSFRADLSTDGSLARQMIELGYVNEISILRDAALSAIDSLENSRHSKEVVTSSMRESRRFIERVIIAGFRDRPEFSPVVAVFTQLLRELQAEAPSKKRRPPKGVRRRHDTRDYWVSCHGKLSMAQFTVPMDVRIFFYADENTKQGATGSAASLSARGWGRDFAEPGEAIPDMSLTMIEKKRIDAEKAVAQAVTSTLVRFVGYDAPLEGERYLLSELIRVLSAEAGTGFDLHLLACRSSANTRVVPTGHTYALEGEEAREGDASVKFAEQQRFINDGHETMMAVSRGKEFDADDARLEPWLRREAKEEARRLTQDPSSILDIDRLTQGTAAVTHFPAWGESGFLGMDFRAKSWAVVENPHPQPSDQVRTRLHDALDGRFEMPLPASLTEARPAPDWRLAFGLFLYGPAQEIGSVKAQYQLWTMTAAFGNSSEQNIEFADADDSDGGRTYTAQKYTVDEIFDYATGIHGPNPGLSANVVDSVVSQQRPSHDGESIAEREPKTEDVLLEVMDDVEYMLAPRWASFVDWIQTYGWHSRQPIHIEASPFPDHPQQQPSEIEIVSDAPPLSHTKPQQVKSEMRRPRSTKKRGKTKKISDVDTFRYDSKNVVNYRLRMVMAGSVVQESQRISEREFNNIFPSFENVAATMSHRGMTHEVLVQGDREMGFTLQNGDPKMPEEIVIVTLNVTVQGARLYNKNELKSGNLSSGGSHLESPGDRHAKPGGRCQFAMLGSIALLFTGEDSYVRALRLAGAAQGSVSRKGGPLAAKLKVTGAAVDQAAFSACLDTKKKIGFG
ncbi:putative adhesin [Streptomyces sp. NPDC005529]|uniref:putative adhesin n=1 Tax=unclassified Streptomyces TaxID=2593676 RepID=UPI0033A4863E